MQTQSPKNLKITYDYDKEHYDNEWECLLEFINREGNVVEYRERDRSKRSALNKILDNAENINEIRNNLSKKI